MTTVLKRVLITFVLNFGLSSAVTCNTPYDCTAYHDINSNDNIDMYANGYKSASVNGSIIINTSINNNIWVWCSGAFSCQSVQSIYITTNYPPDILNMRFYGTGSAQTISSISSAVSVCYSSSACSYSTIESDFTVCDGDQSCSNCIINPKGLTNKITGYGAYSLKNATIDSIKSGGRFTIDFAGYHAAFGALIICQSGHICTINCYSNSCDYLTTQCLDNNNCVINYFPSIANAPQSQIVLYDSLSLTTTNDINCNQATSLSFDNYEQHSNGADLIINADIVSSICCRASKSCYSTNSIQYNGTVICSGEDACRFIGLIKNSGDLFCEAAMSCYGSTISNNNSRNIYCLGFGSCASSTIIGIGNIYCSGSSGCQFANITSTGDGNNLNIYFLGAMSIRGTHIHCRKNDVCRIIVGSDGFQGTVHPIICDGECIVECETTDIKWCPSIITTNPTNNPTMNPSYPTFVPTISTINPTFIPTFIPTTNPTFEPTINPTSITIQPTTNPTQEPTKIPTMEPIVQTKNEMVSSTLFEDIEEHNDDCRMLYIIIGFIGLFIICCIIFGVFLWKKHRQKSASKLEQKSASKGIELGSVSPHSYDNEEEKELAVSNEIHKLCDRCGKSVSANHEKMNGKDGNVFCNNCSDTFYD
eukprot:333271_1